MDHLSLIDKQGLFYRNNFRKLLKLAFVLVITAFCLLAFISYRQIERPIAQYFVTTIDGTLVEIKPINLP